MPRPGLTNATVPPFLNSLETWVGSPEYENRPGVSMWTYSLAASSPRAGEGALRSAAESARDRGTSAPARRAADPLRFIREQAFISRTSSPSSILFRNGGYRCTGPQTTTRGDKAARPHDATTGRGGCQTAVPQAPRTRSYPRISVSSRTRGAGSGSPATGPRVGASTDPRKVTRVMTAPTA